MYVISPAPRGRRAEVRGQPRDEAVKRPAAEDPLSASGGARKDGGLREAGDVDVARRRRDPEGERPVVETAAEIGGLVERGEVRGQPRDERVGSTAESALGAADGAREIGGLRLPRNVHLVRRETNRDGNILPTAPG